MNLLNWRNFWILCVLIEFFIIYKTMISEKTLHCGVVIDKYTGGRVHKQRISDEYRLVIKYDKGVIEDENVIADTYYNSQINRRVCFSRLEELDRFYSILILMWPLCVLFLALGIWMSNDLLFS